MQGLDYTSPIAGASLKAAGIDFVCRYVTPSLSWKCLQPGEFADLVANGIGVVFNFEGEANQMLDGYARGVADAAEARNYIRSLPGVPADYDPHVYFSCDFDEAPHQDAAIFSYLDGTAKVLGGYHHNGIYAGLYTCQRVFNAGKATRIWQTQAWSGGNVDSQVSIMQLNNSGYRYVDGVECDIDEAYATDFGQFGGNMDLILDQLSGPVGPDGERHGWPQLGGHSLVDALAVIGQKLDIPGFAPPVVTLTAPTALRVSDTPAGIPVANLTFLWEQVVNPRLGCGYSWGGSFDSNDVLTGTDCSGAVSAELSALVNGRNMDWTRQFYTGTFAGANPGDTGPWGGVADTTNLECISSPSAAPFGTAAIIAVRQMADPADSHMIISVPEFVGGPWTTIEMGGNANNYHLGEVSIGDQEFNQFFILPGPIV